MILYPSSLPYELGGDQLGAYEGVFGNIESTLPPVVAGDGSLSDGSDASGVTTVATQVADGASACSVVAIDFQANFSTINPAGFGTLFRFGRVLDSEHFGAAEWLGSEWMLFPAASTAWLNRDDPTHFVPVRLPDDFNSLPITPTDYRSDDASVGGSDDYYSWGVPDEPSAISLMSTGVTLAFSTRITTEMRDEQFSVLDFTEIGLIIDGTLASGRPRPFRAPQRLYPRSDARLWPRPGSVQDSPRRVGGYR